jgi:predicted MFS family arabinose efflux permease
VVLWVCYALNHADRQVKYTLFPAVQKQFGYSDAVLGLTGAVFLWVYGICSPFAGVLGDRISKFSMVVGSLVVWSSLTILSGLAPNGSFLLVCRALLGVSESMFFPAAFALMAAAHPSKSRSRAIGFFATSQPAGMALGGSLSGFVAERFQWRLSFWLLGAMGLLFALPLRRLLKSLPKEFDRGQGAQKVRFADFRILGRIPSLITVALLMSVLTFGIYLVYTWLPTMFYDKFHLGLGRAGFEASFYPQIGSLIGVLLGGWAGDQCYSKLHGARFWALLIAFFGAACAIYTLGVSSTLGFARSAATASAFFASACSVNQYPVAFDVVPSTLRSTTVGGMNFLAALASGFAPFLGGVFRHLIGVDRLMAFTAMSFIVFGALAVLGFTWSHRQESTRLAIQTSANQP